MTSDVEREFAALAETLRVSTVAVRSARDAGSGSGVVWSDGATIVTNAHVARTAQVEIETADGRRLRGSVERRDERRDLASVRVAADGLRGARTRDPAELRVGELVVAFGHPLGVRDVLSSGVIATPYRAGRGRFVCSDVKLAPGNSGGPLADVSGRVIGINSMIAGGLALSVPTDDVQRFLGEAVAAPRLGVRLAPVRFGDGRRAHAVIATEPGSAAERSGILVGDVIVTPSPDQLGSARAIDIVRGGSPLTVTVSRERSEAAAAA